MADIVTNASNLNQPKVLKSAFETFVTSQELAPFMGSGEDAIIQRQVRVGKGAGDTTYFSLRGILPTSAIVSGTTQLEGAETQQELFDFGIVVDNKRSATVVPNRKLTDLRTPIALVEYMRPLLLDQHARALRDDIIATADVTATPNRTRVLFGADDANYNATLATALATVDATNDKLSVAMIRTAVDKARNVASVSGGVESREIRPSSFKTINGALQRSYVLWVDAEGARQLQADSEFKELRDDTRSNMISMPYFNGQDYLGMVEGVMVYRIDAMSALTKAAAGAAGIDVGHAVLCGAQAFGLSFGNVGSFEKSDNTDYNFNAKIGYHVIRGQEMFTFDTGAGAVEQGVVHLFYAK